MTNNKQVLHREHRKQRDRVHQRLAVKMVKLATPHVVFELKASRRTVLSHPVTGAQLERSVQEMTYGETGGTGE